VVNNNNAVEVSNIETGHLASNNIIAYSKKLWTYFHEIVNRNIWPAGTRNTRLHFRTDLVPGSFSTFAALEHNRLDVFRY